MNFPNNVLHHLSPRVLRAKYAAFYAKDRDMAIIATLAFVGELIWIALVNAGYHCDSPGYWQYAMQMIGKFQPTYVTWTRTPGYPLMLLLLVAPFHTFYLLLLVHAAMAVAMPMLVYKTVALYHRRAAFYIALLFILSLSPFMFSKLFMTEHLYKFLSVLVVYYFCRVLHLKTCTFKDLRPLTLTAAFLALTRPTAALIFLTIIAVLFVVRWRWWRAILLSLSIPFALLAATSLFVSLTTLPPVHMNWTEKAPGAPNKLTELQFYDLYMYHPDLLFNAEAGEKRAALKKVTERFVTEQSRWDNWAPPQYFRPYTKRPDALLQKMREGGSRPYYMLLRNAVLLYRAAGTNAETQKLAKNLIGNVVWEVYRENPSLIPEFWARYGTAVLKTAGAGPMMIAYSMFYHDHVARLAPENGPETARFFQILRDHFTYIPEAIPGVAPIATYKKDYSHKPDELIKEVFTGGPDGGIFYNSWIIMDQYLGPIEAVKIYAGLVQEGKANGWTAKASFYEHFFKRGMTHWGRLMIDPFLKQGVQILGMFESVPFYFDYALVYCEDTGKPRMTKELQGGMRLFDFIPSQPGVAMSSQVYPSAWHAGMHILWDIGRFTAQIIIVLGVWFCFRSRTIIPILVLLAAILHHSLSHAFLIAAQTRYADQMQPMIYLCAGLVLAGVAEYRHRRKARKGG